MTGTVSTVANLSMDPPVGIEKTLHKIIPEDELARYGVHKHGLNGWFIAPGVMYDTEGTAGGGGSFLGRSTANEDDITLSAGSLTIAWSTASKPAKRTNGSAPT